jgi:hypothetical protein
MSPLEFLSLLIDRTPTAPVRQCAPLPTSEAGQGAKALGADGWAHPLKSAVA